MTGRPRPFFVPMIGLVLLFAALGPAVGGALFFPASFVLNPLVGIGVLAVFRLTTALLGHAAGWILVYAIGIGPAVATGLLYALWDAAAPARAPRALLAAAFAGFAAYGFLWPLAWLASPVGAAIAPDYPHLAAALTKAFEQVINPALRHAFVAAAAIAGLVCAFAANLLGLSMRPGFAPAAALPSTSEGV